MLSDYYKLAKPGIIYGNLLTVTAGFLLACKGSFGGYLYLLLAATLLGIACVIGSACVFNNYIDRNIDKVMQRTRKRATVTGHISKRATLVYGTVLGLIGFYLLLEWTNLLVVSLGLLAYVDYIVFYGYTKRHSVHGTVVGSISGALPVVAGYCAVTQRLDLIAAALFLILVCWQMPHFYAIAIFRGKDYAAAHIPVLPLAKGINITKRYMVAYITAFILATVWIWFLGYGNYVYLALVLGMGLYWLWLGFKGFKTKDDSRWARQMFLASLLIILFLSLILSVGTLLP